MNLDATDRCSFDRLLEDELQRTVGEVEGPTPDPRQAAYQAKFLARPGSGSRGPMHLFSGRLALVIAGAALLLAGGSVAAMAGWGGAQPEVWGRAIATAVEDCKGQLTGGQHGMGKCINPNAKERSQGQPGGSGTSSSPAPVGGSGTPGSSAPLGASGGPGSGPGSGAVVNASGGAPSYPLPSSPPTGFHPDPTVMPGTAGPLPTPGAAASHGQGHGKAPGQGAGQPAPRAPSGPRGKPDKAGTGPKAGGNAKPDNGGDGKSNGHAHTSPSPSP
jgi:hypothetical protein